jgi:hypothetical protein
MRDKIRRARLIAAAALLLAIPLAGCETKPLTVQLPGFGDGAIDGLWLWRQSATGGYERICRIDFLGLHQNGGGFEVLRYIQNCLDEHPGLELRARVERAIGDPSTALVHLWYMRWEDPGSYRGTAFNVYGESGLSASNVQL